MIRSLNLPLAVSTLITQILLILSLCGCDNITNDFSFQNQNSEQIHSRSSDVHDSLYYYYNGKIVQLDIDFSKRFVVFSDDNLLARSEDTNQSETSHKRKIVDWNNDNASNVQAFDSRQIIAIDYVLKDGTPIYNTFWIKLKQEADINALSSILEPVGCRIIGRYPYNSLWVEIWNDNQSIFSTSLEAANYVFENGDFESVDYEFGIREDNFLMASQYKPSDALYSQQWNLNSTAGINIEEAWKYTLGSSNIITAVVDTRIEYNHPDLKGQLTDIKFETSYIPNSSVDPNHGTKVSGIIGAVHNNIFCSGIAPNSKIMPVELNFSDYTLLGSALAESIEFAWRNDADVINCSWKVFQNRPLLEEALRNALTKGRNALGCVICFASGNDKIIEYPGNLEPDFIVVGNTDKSGTVLSYSGKGNELDIVAPGKDFPLLAGLSTTTDEGTSLAAPHVAGIAALILSYAPELTQKQVGTLINDSGTDDHWTIDRGWGKIDAGKTFYWLNYKFNNIKLPKTYPTLQNSILTISLEAPRSTKLTWSSQKGTMVSAAGNYANIRYSGKETTDVITVETEYLGKKYKTSKTVTVYNEAIITDVEPIVDISDINNLHLMIRCSDSTANITWSILDTQNGSFEYRGFDYEYDAMFSSVANLCASFSVRTYADLNPSPTCRILIEATCKGYDSVIAEVNWDTYSRQWVASISGSMLMKKQQINNE